MSAGTSSRSLGWDDRAAAGTPAGRNEASCEALHRGAEEASRTNAVSSAAIEAPVLCLLRPHRPQISMKRGRDVKVRVLAARSGDRGCPVSRAEGVARSPGGTRRALDSGRCRAGREPSWSAGRSLAAGLGCPSPCHGWSGAQFSIACSGQDHVYGRLAPIAQFRRGPSCGQN
jgi:hypothetical protein